MQDLFGGDKNVAPSLPVLVVRNIALNGEVKKEPEVIVPLP